MRGPIDRPLCIYALQHTLADKRTPVRFGGQTERQPFWQPVLGQAPDKVDKATCWAQSSRKHFLRELAIHFIESLIKAKGGIMECHVMNGRRRVWI